MTQSQGPGWDTSPNQQPPPPGAPPPPPTQSGWPTKYCTACGSAIDARADVCPRCGVRQGGTVPGEGKSRVLTIFLALLLGNLGIHRFYLGDVAWGVIYLVFFWTGIPGVIAWFEALYFLTRSDHDWSTMYGGPVRASNGLGIGCAWILAVGPLVLIAVGLLVLLLGA